MQFIKKRKNITNLNLLKITLIHILAKIYET